MPAGRGSGERTGELMAQYAADADYLADQYSDSQKLRIRQETHALYSECAGTFFDWMLARIEANPGDELADIGCGHGAYHAPLAQMGVRITAVDASAGMVVEAQRLARRDRWPIRVLQADAQALPLAPQWFDRIMANHMLYHVPDQRAALGELRRIARPGARVVLATMAADSGRLLHDLHAAAAAEVGLAATPHDGARFNLDHIGLVRAFFPNAEVVRREDAFLFPDVESVLRYYATGIIDHIDAPPPDAGHRAQLMRAMALRVADILAVDGVLRVPKTAGCFIANL